MADNEEFGHFSVKNIINGILCIAVALPAIFVGRYICFSPECNAVQHAPVSLDELPNVWNDFQANPWLMTCRIGLHHPLIFVNIVFLLNVCVLFWLISLIQASTWLIDPYWTLIPPLIGLFYHYHPHSSGRDDLRAQIALALVFIWSIRLTHSYFRRENFKFGVREDWRFADMKKDLRGHWWWISFFAAFVSQQPMLVGITLPLWSVNLGKLCSKPFDATDIAIIGLCVIGIVTAYFADTQLRRFMLKNEALQKAGKAKVLILETGLWKYSRHPNYFGEQLWWWSLGLLGVVTGEAWTLVGTLFNTLIMMQVTNLTETRMSKGSSERVAAFKEYQKRTSVWFPWFPGKKAAKSA